MLLARNQVSPDLSFVVHYYDADADWTTLDCRWWRVVEAARCWPIVNVVLPSAVNHFHMRKTLSAMDRMVAVADDGFVVRDALSDDGVDRSLIRLTGWQECGPVKAE